MICEIDKFIKRMLIGVNAFAFIMHTIDIKFRLMVATSTSTKNINTGYFNASGRCASIETFVEFILFFCL